MFERFTDGAKQAVVLAQEEARRLGHNYVGTEHILLGLLRAEEGLAGRSLASLGISTEDVRATLMRVVGQSDEAVVGQIPFTPRAKRVLELSLREALALGHNYIGTEHILLGLARENDGVAARILLDAGVDAEQIRRDVTSALAGAPGATRTKVGMMPPGFMRRVPGRHMQPARWVYFVVSAAAEELPDVLNSYGDVGWELAGALPDGEAVRLIFKKPA